MIEKEWYTDSFLFKYNNQEYIVLVKRYEEDKKPRHYLVKLEFLKKDNFDHKLTTGANSVKLEVAPIEIYRYFNLKRSESTNNPLEHFYRSLGQAIPHFKVETQTDTELKAMVISLSESDKDDPNKQYCFRVRRLGLKADGSPKEQSQYNHDKAKLLVRDVYDDLGCDDEKHISFDFSVDINKKKDRKDLVYNFVKNGGTTKKLSSSNNI